MATKLRLSLEDGRTATARLEAWMQALLCVLEPHVRAYVFQLAEQFDGEQIKLYEPEAAGPRYHMADHLVNELKGG